MVSALLVHQLFLHDQLCMFLFMQPLEEEPEGFYFSFTRILNMVTRQGASWANSLGSVGKITKKQTLKP